MTEKNLQTLRLIRQQGPELETLAAMIAKVQRKSGEIPWHGGGKTDPWDHVEAAMGLSIGGYVLQAQRAFEWLAEMQLADGSWFAAYRNGSAADKTRDANMSAYIAVGVWHHYLITGDLVFAKRMWDTIRSAMAFVLSLQAPGGEIHWAVSPQGTVDARALLTGSSSIYLSLKCALALAQHLGRAVPAWRMALIRLGRAIRCRPRLFDMSKSRYAMDWFYPILCGAVTGTEACRRIRAMWEKFVISGHGCRCVSDQPWVTVAETCELSLTLSAMGKQRLAETVFSWIQGRTYPDGSYWCGFTCPDLTVWPEDKLTWTNAAVLLAADALYKLTPGGRIFSHEAWNGPEFVFAWAASRAVRKVYPSG